jgi:hypothetical protein
MTQANQETTTPARAVSGNWMQENHRRFEELYAKWLDVRAQQERAEDLAAVEDDDAIARDLMAVPVFKSWLLVRKMEVYEHYLVGTGGDCPEWTDNRLVSWFGAIKADILNALGD